MKLFYKGLRLNLIKEKEMFFEKMKKISHQGTKMLLCGVAPCLGGKKLYGG